MVLIHLQSGVVWQIISQKFRFCIIIFLSGIWAAVSNMSTDSCICRLWSIIRYHKFRWKPKSNWTSLQA